MNTRCILTALIAAAIAAGITWHFTRPAAPAPAPAAPVAAAPAAAPKSAVVPQVAAPQVAPAPVPAAPPAPTATGASAPDPTTQAVAELNAAIGDIASLLQAGDMATLIDRYMPPQVKAQMPPDALAQMQQQMQSPQAQQQLQMAVQMLQSIQGQTPSFNETGDRATYQMTPPAELANLAPPGASVPATIPVTFIKVDGHWYINNGPGL